MATTVQEDAAFEELLFAEALVSSDLSSRVKIHATDVDRFDAFSLRRQVFRPVKKDERTIRA